MPEVSICCCLQAIFPKSTGTANSSAVLCHLQTCWFNRGKESEHCFFMSFTDGLFVYAEENITELLLINNVRRRRPLTYPFVADSSSPFSGAFFQKTSF